MDKKALDKYLTTPPVDTFTPWCEQVINQLSDEFYDENSLWIEEYEGLCNKWLNKLFNRSLDPQVVASVIQRAFKLYIKP